MGNDRFNDTALSAELESLIHAELLPIAKELTARGETFSAAESLTGGLMSAYCVDIPGSSEWFLEGFVTYSPKAKIDHLGVPAELIEKNTMVDAEVTLEMARGARRESGSDYSVAMSGLSGPFFHSDGTPYPMDPRHVPGLVFVACSSEKGEAVHRYVLTGTRAEIRRMTVLKAVQMLANMLQIGEGYAIIGL
ncbi:MAG: CinA family protein [Clostridia bacterium]|nr:CinA family protein [Clostridia bacterium]